ncbi:hypothetical protein IEN85_02205 [Pelagicoccus sp. NFK12]|uniref:Uncharacterized protein n=1 Tax=Pelagicoccus enzymogenes TaxID=2773457 RepID=A0A927IGE5_9BACT|nr:hypothetical protein [Pelagicoccus enzymogenes]MBD5778305.1 hypothetical protein [Pelagicoccus enzymogenes]
MTSTLLQDPVGESDFRIHSLFRATRFAASYVVGAERRRKNREWEAAKMDLAEKAGGSELDWQETGALLDEAIGGIDSFRIATKVAPT